MNQKYLYPAIFLLALTAISCSRMNDLHDKYLDGEIVYAAQVDSVEVLSGDGRALMNLEIRSQRIKFIRIYWNNYADSTDVAIDNQVGVFPQMLENLQENDYIFNLVSYDNFNNYSLPFEKSGVVYGDRFRSRLYNRTINTFLAGDAGLTVNWNDPPDNAITSFIKYTAKDGKEKTIKVPINENSTEITEWASGLSYQTCFLPEKTAIDTFYSEWRTISEVPYKYSTAGWTASCRDGNHGWGAAGGEPDKVLDGNLSTGWHSRVGSSLPQCLVVDMKDEKPVDHIVLRFQPNAIANNWIYLKTVQVYMTSEEATPNEYQPEWGEPVATYEYPGGIDVVTIPFKQNARGRYLIMYFPNSSSNTYISFTELDVYKE